MFKYRAVYAVLWLAAAMLMMQRVEEIYMVIFLFFCLLPAVIWSGLRLSVGKMETEIKVERTPELKNAFKVRILAKPAGFSLAGRMQMKVSIRNKLFSTESNRIVMLYPNGKIYAAEILEESCSCGKYIVTGTDLYALDYLGLFRRRIFFCDSAKTTIYPMLYDSGIPDLNGTGNSRSTGSRVQKSYVPGDAFLGVREYQDGDEQSRIHWKLSAKWDTLVMREYGTEMNEELLLITDICASYDREENSRVLSALASLSTCLLKEGVRHLVLYPCGDMVKKHVIATSDGYIEMMNQVLETPLSTSTVLELLQATEQTDQFKQQLFLTAREESEIPTWFRNQENLELHLI